MTSSAAQSPAADARLADELLTVTARPIPPDTLVLAVRGEVDLSTIARLRAALRAHLDAAARRMIVDLTGVDFLCAGGLSVLVAIQEMATASGCDLRLVASTRVVQRPLTVTGLDDVFDIRPDLAGALRGTG